METARQSGTPFYFVAQECHVGYDRLVNEDAIGSFTTPNGELFVVADGLSGHAGAGVASRLAMAAFHKCLMEEKGDPAELMRRASVRADEAVIEAGEAYPELKGLGSSLVALLLKNNEAWYINVGDSRLYLSSASGFRRLTRGASPPPREIINGRPGDEARPRSLGGGLNPGSLQPGRHFYRADDTFLLATSGLQPLVDDKEIRAILGRAASPEERARNLIETAVLADGADNISVQLVAFKPGPEAAESSGASRPGLGKAFFLGLAGGFILGAALTYFLM